MKKFVIFFAIVAFLLVGGEFIWKKLFNKPYKPPTDMVQNQDSSTSPQQSGVFLGNNQHSFIIKFNGNIWVDSSTIDPATGFTSGTQITPIEKFPDLNAYSWSEVNVQGYGGSPFMFETLPNNQGFLLILREITSDTVTGNFYIFHFNESQLGQIKKPILTFHNFNNTGSGDGAPWFSDISRDGKYVSFVLTGCVECGGAMSQTFAYAIEKGKGVNLGKVTAFSWKANGEYTYSDLPQACLSISDSNPDIGGKCEAAMKNLPIKSGRI